MVTSLSIGTGGLGRFGNQLFTIAGVIGIATKNGLDFGFPHWKNYDNALFGGEVTDFEKVFVNPLPRIPDGRQWQKIDYYWGYKDIQLSAGDWDIFAHLQSPKYFEHCIDLVRHYFRIKDEPEQNDYTIIHIRWGDYQFGGKNAYHPRCEFDYINKAISYFPESEKFLLFSDEFDNVYESIKGNSYTKRIEKGNSGDYLSDFKIMKNGKNFIISNSSFSAMAAILSPNKNKKVVTPSGKTWFGSVADIDGKDIIDKDWLEIDIW